MSLPAAAPGPEDGDAAQVVARTPLTSTSTSASDLRTTDSHRGLPGGRVVTVGTLTVIGAAVVEVLVTDTIGLWTGITLVVVSVVAALVTRAGDRSLPAMMPPLAFLAAALVAGQALLPTGNDALWTKEVLMLLDVLGPNAPWVVAATLLAVTISTVRHVVDRRRARRA